MTKSRSVEPSFGQKRALSLALVIWGCASCSFPDPSPADGVSERSIQVDEQTLRYLSAGTSGAPIVLIHGWPQSSEEWRGIMPELAEDHVVIAPDLRGIGGSSAPEEDWRKQILAGDIHKLVEALNLERPLIVGHDIGGMVAYAYGRQFEEDAGGIAILDVPIPGLAPWEALMQTPNVWHFHFHDQEPLAEALVAGRQVEYFRYFIDHVAANPGAISDEAVAAYADAYSTPEQLHAGFELYRAFDADSEFFASQTSAIDLPHWIVGAESSMGQSLPVLADDLKQHGVGEVHQVVIGASGHWLAEEQPEATVQAILELARMTSSARETRE
ncbi:alpha/beta fold hydrolase [Sorangium sp. So ce385]|uniref:alpha/beta fold hydrolase n=1 Tax=Sorangium sp. So ce385 TaxID=3133308 RepID=UPI003F5B9276